MATTAIYGEFSALEAYTLEQIGAKFNRDRTWAYYAFIKPSEHHTRRRLVDGDGRPIPGVLHKKIGTTYIVTGQALIAWIMEYGERNTD